MGQKCQSRWWKREIMSANYLMCRRFILDQLNPLWSSLMTLSKFNQWCAILIEFWLLYNSRSSKNLAMGLIGPKEFDGTWDNFRSLFLFFIICFGSEEEYCTLPKCVIPFSKKTLVVSFKNDVNYKFWVWNTYVKETSTFRKSSKLSYWTRHKF